MILENHLCLISSADELAGPGDVVGQRELGLSGCARRAVRSQAEPGSEKTFTSQKRSELAKIECFGNLGLFGWSKTRVFANPDPKGLANVNAFIHPVGSGLSNG